MKKTIFRPLLSTTKYICNRFIIRPVFKLNKWHDYPYEHKQYAMDMVDFINNDNGVIKWDLIATNQDSIVEVGCGRGDIIGRIRIPCSEKVGYDIDTNILKVGGFFHKDVKMKKGSFYDIEEKRISILIMVNFIQSISSDDLEASLSYVQKHSNVRMVIFDHLELEEGSSYKYSHFGEKLLPEFSRVYVSRKYPTKFKADRIIEYWVKNEVLY